VASTLVPVCRVIRIYLGQRLNYLELRKGHLLTWFRKEEGMPRVRDAEIAKEPLEEQHTASLTIPERGIRTCGSFQHACWRNG
jgi:hypothetical protein